MHAAADRRYVAAAGALFQINYEVESIEIYLVWKLIPLTLEVLDNDFNIFL
jgi:hypothetical protein